MRCRDQQKDINWTAGKKLCRQRNERKRKVFFPEEKAPFKKLSLEKKRNSGEHKNKKEKDALWCFRKDRERNDHPFSFEAFLSLSLLFSRASLQSLTRFLKEETVKSAWGFVVIKGCWILYQQKQCSWNKSLCQLVLKKTWVTPLKSIEGKSIHTWAELR